MDWTTLFSILLPLVVSGIAFIAYKHPEGYSGVANVATKYIIMLFVGFTGYCFGSIRWLILDLYEVRTGLDNISELDSLDLSIKVVFI